MNFVSFYRCRNELGGLPNDIWVVSGKVWPVDTCTSFPTLNSMLCFYRTTFPMLKDSLSIGCRLRQVTRSKSIISGKICKKWNLNIDWALLIKCYCQAVRLNLKVTWNRPKKKKIMDSHLSRLRIQALWMVQVYDSLEQSWDKNEVVTGMKVWAHLWGNRSWNILKAMSPSIWLSNVYLMQTEGKALSCSP